MPRSIRDRRPWLAAIVTACLSAACSSSAPSPAPEPAPLPRAPILLVTLDTTRADAVGPDAAGVQTPAFNALAARGLRFRQAYATAPETLPSHSSMMTGLYPAGHGVRENGRFLSTAFPVLAERLKERGYRTAAFVSAFALARRFGLARGFDVYDDELPTDGRAERTAQATTDRALRYLSASAADAPLFLWVHYYDPHAPYEPPAPFAEAHRGQPYLGEVAAMDEQLGRLVAAFTARAGATGAIVVASDHGEGLGDHGELQHGHLVYQSTMHVPMVMVGPGVGAGVSDEPVSTRRIFHTVLAFAGLMSEGGLQRPSRELVIGEAMKPFLQYGWQPQVMGVSGRHKAILTGSLEVFDVVADPDETRDVAATGVLPATARTSLEEYPIPSPDQATAMAPMDEQARRQLASLGYIGATAAPAVRRDAPRPADMTRLFGPLEQASGLFTAGRYREVVPVLERILAADPNNLDATLRLATAFSSLGRDAQAVATFRRAATLAPDSEDVRTYLGLHYARARQAALAIPLLERVLAVSPERVPALEALAQLREEEGRPTDALDLRKRLQRLRPAGPAELARIGKLAMDAGMTREAIAAFEQARAAQGPTFAHDLELGVLYLDARDFEPARAALDRVPASHPDYSIALFKRAQVSVLLKEPDQDARIAAARRGADATTRELIARERLFK